MIYLLPLRGGNPVARLNQYLGGANMRIKRRMRPPPERGYWNSRLVATFLQVLLVDLPRSITPACDRALIPIVGFNPGSNQNASSDEVNILLL